MLPSCVTTCIGRATLFGDSNDPDSVVAAMIAQPNVMRLKEEMGTEQAVRVAPRLDVRQRAAAGSGRGQSGIGLAVSCRDLSAAAVGTALVDRPARIRLVSEAPAEQRSDRARLPVTQAMAGSLARREIFARLKRFGEEAWDEASRARVAPDRLPASRHRLPASIAAFVRWPAPTRQSAMELSCRQAPCQATKQRWPRGA